VKPAHSANGKPSRVFIVKRRRVFSRLQLRAGFALVTHPRLTNPPHDIQRLLAFSVWCRTRVSTLAATPLRPRLDWFPRETAR